MPYSYAKSYCIFFKSSYLRRCDKLNLSGYVEERESMRLTLTNLCNDLVACFYVKRLFVHFLQVVVYFILMVISNIKLNFRMTSKQAHVCSWFCLIRFAFLKMSSWMHSMPNTIKYFRIIFLQRKGYTYIKINPRSCV